MSFAYEVTTADRAPLPGALFAAGAHLGYDKHEHRRPFARFFRATALPPQLQAAQAGRLPAGQGFDLREGVAALNRASLHDGENGWARLPSGITYVACRTDMPGVTAAMWDWWFGWHGSDSARYKLWHPGAHQRTALGDDRSTDRTLSDRQRYVGNVSYVDEFIGSTLHRLAIRFVDPAQLGLDERPGTLHVCARVGYRNVPIAFGWLVHQVRPTGEGSQMRSRFFLNDVHLLPGVARSGSPLAAVLATPLARGVAARLPARVTAVGLPRTIGPDLLLHCATEMNHLASFLPDLHAEFDGSP